jgi:hypothetical protein
MSMAGSARKRRSQIMLDDELYEALVREAEIEGRSVSALVREAVAEWLAPRSQRRIQETPFWELVGQGDGGQGDGEPISENVDRYLYAAPNRAKE